MQLCCGGGALTVDCPVRRVRVLATALLSALLLAANVQAAEPEKQPAATKKVAKKSGERVPKKLGELTLGQPIPQAYGGGESETVQRAGASVTLEMWRALAPGMPDAVEGAYVATYKGGVASVRFGLSYAVKFEDVHRYFTERYGKGKRTNVRTPSKPGAHPDCPKFYLIQEWSSGGSTLELEWGSGLYVTLSGELQREMELDPDERSEAESCV